MGSSRGQRGSRDERGRAGQGEAARVRAEPGRREQQAGRAPMACEPETEQSISAEQQCTRHGQPIHHRSRKMLIRFQLDAAWAAARTQAEAPAVIGRRPE